MDISICTLLITFLISFDSIQFSSQGISFGTCSHPKLLPETVHMLETKVGLPTFQSLIYDDAVHVLLLGQMATNGAHNIGILTTEGWKLMNDDELEIYNMIRRRNPHALAGAYRIPHIAYKKGDKIFRLSEVTHSLVKVAECFQKTGEMVFLIPRLGGASQEMRPIEGDELKRGHEYIARYWRGMWLVKDLLPPEEEMVLEQHHH
ncbi:uncharacterized protein LOC117175487 isoform X1 [Belonocnema kinseyi]|uniref:uncharacterized protein LOC117175487 isoform X1 n=1 Tax=Belonocnema kinseyi TaxID=2817044 RepID=UPI00143D91BC|nr:uncharacterized protein LOC117175487 isoform X1 [Belonocnema kinseyi]